MGHINEGARILTMVNLKMITKPLKYCQIHKMKFVMGDGHKNHFVVLLRLFAFDCGFNIVRGAGQIS